MRLDVLDAQKLERQGCVDAWVSLYWDEPYNTEGSFTLEVRPTAENLALLQEGCWVKRSDRTPVPAPDTRHDEVIAANTAALQEANKKLSEMVRQANALVLSDNMKVSSRVAASGTAQVAAAANNYHREGDTTVNQYIYSKAQSAADLARETRWEADRAKARKT